MTFILDEPVNKEYKPGDRITGRYQSMKSSDDRLEVSITLVAKAVSVLRTSTGVTSKSGVVPLLTKTIGTTRLADTAEGLKVWWFEMPVPRMMSTFEVAGGPSVLGDDWEEDGPFPSSHLQHRLALPPTFSSERVHLSDGSKMITRVLYYIRANLQRPLPMEQLEPIEQDIVFVPSTRHTNADGGVQVMDSEVEIRSSKLLSSSDPEIMRNPSTGLKSTLKHLTTPKLCLEVRTSCVKETELRESFPLRVIFRRVPEKSNVTKAPLIKIESVSVSLHSLVWLRFNEVFDAHKKKYADKTVFHQTIVLDKVVEESYTSHVDLPSHELVPTFKTPNVVHTYKMTVEWTFVCANVRTVSEETMPLVIKPLQVESSAAPAPQHPPQHEAPPPSYEDATR